MVEREATYRAIALAELVDQPIQIFHVSCPEVADEIARAQARGLKVWGETCPQYFVLSAADMDRPGFEGAKYMCSPAPRDREASDGLWDAVRLYPAKGAIAPGAAADLVLEDPARQTTITNARLQHVIDYTPYEGLEVTGWPVATVRRGEVVMRDGAVTAPPGSGRFLARGPYTAIAPTARLPDGFDASAFAV